MNITHLIWLDYFVEKIVRKHSVLADEVEEVFYNRPRIQRAGRGDIQGEDLYRALGQSNDGRRLAVFFIYKGRGEALVISAREMSLKERKSYDKRKK